MNTFIELINQAISDMEESLKDAEDDAERDSIRTTIAAYRWCVQTYYETHNTVTLPSKEWSDDSILNVGKLRREILRQMKYAATSNENDLITDFKVTLRVLDIVLGE